MGLANTRSSKGGRLGRVTVFSEGHIDKASSFYAVNNSPTVNIYSNVSTSHTMEHVLSN